MKTMLIQAAIVAVIVFGYLAWDADALYAWMSGDVEFVAPVSECDLHQETCEASLIDGTLLSLSITPRPIPVMEKLLFTVKADHLKHDTLKLEMYGLNMNMGRYTYMLKRDENGTYTGEGMIPSCVEKMQWRTNIIAESPTKRIGTYFTFKTE